MCYVAARVEGDELRERWLLSCYSTHGVIVSRVQVLVMLCGCWGCEGDRRPAGGLLAHGRAIGKVFPSNAGLIRLIHLLFLYGVVYLTPKQDFLDL
jgi:hypothetical protein